MYGFPRGFDPSFLIGHNLEMVCFSVNQMYLHFDKEVTIKVEGTFSHQSSGNRSDTKIVQMPIQQSAVMQLLEHTVTQAAGDERGTLAMTFDNGHILKCFETVGYESYEIKHGNDRVIV